jgi:hypothetical protein
MNTITTTEDMLETDESFNHTNVDFLNEQKDIVTRLNCLEVLETIRENGWCPQLEDLFGDEIPEITSQAELDALYDKLLPDTEVSEENLAAYAAAEFGIIFALVAMAVLIVKIMTGKRKKIIVNNTIFAALKNENFAELGFDDYYYVFSHLYLDSLCDTVLQSIHAIFSGNPADLTDITKVEKLSRYRNTVKKTTMDKRLEREYSIGIDNSGNTVVMSDVPKMDVNTLGELGWTTQSVMKTREKMVKIFALLETVSLKAKSAKQRLKQGRQSTTISNKEARTCKRRLKKTISLLAGDISLLTWNFYVVIKLSPIIKYKKY